MPDSRIPGLRRAEERRRRDAREQRRLELEEQAKRDEEVARHKADEAREKANAIERDNALSDVLSRFLSFVSGALIATGVIVPVFRPQLVPGQDDTVGDGTITERIQALDVWIAVVVGLLFLLGAAFATRLKKGKPND